MPVFELHFAQPHTTCGARVVDQTVDTPVLLPRERRARVPVCGIGDVQAHGREPRMGCEPLIGHVARDDDRAVIEQRRHLCGALTLRRAGNDDDSVIKTLVGRLLHPGPSPMLLHHRSGRLEP